MEKILFNTKKDFIEYKNSCKNDEYTKYFFSKPEKYPAVGIKEFFSVGSLGTKIYIEDYVYLSDFE